MVISARRVAREWTLKILYQMDVGKAPLPEALESALDRLRLEFVHRGSRTASGSRIEEISLDAITQELRDTLPTLRPPLERALATVTGRLLREGPYWQEVRLERSIRAQMPGVPLVPPRLLAPLPNSLFVPETPDPTDGLAVQLAALTPDERERFVRFVTWARAELPRLLEPELRKTARALAGDLRDNRPLGATPEQMQAYLLRRREEFNRDAETYWHKVATMVQKQTGDWLRTAAFTVKLVTGTWESREAIDRAMGDLAAGWRLERQVAVDRSILRLAGFELLFLPGVPISATINEAVELAKKYSTAESSRFVNGVLGALAARVGEKKPSADADPESEEPDEVVDIPDISDLEESDHRPSNIEPRTEVDREEAGTE